MFYRITIDLAFTDQDSIADILDKALGHLDNAITINPGQENEERGSIRTLKCYHDENPSKPCEQISLSQTPTAL